MIASLRRRLWDLRLRHLPIHYRSNRHGSYWSWRGRQFLRRPGPQPRTDMP